MFRQLFMTFYGESRADHHTQEHLHESPQVMTLPLVILAIGAVFAGFVGLPGVLGGSQFANWLEPVIHAHEEAHASARARVGSDGGFCFGGVVGRFSRVSDVSPGITFAGDLCRSCRRIVLSFVRPQMVFR